jgi:hypothetical protein
MPLGDDTVERALQNVRDDVQTAFQGVLTMRENDGIAFELHGADIDSNEVIGTSNVVVAIPWVFRCTHTGPFLGVPATMVDLELRGVTFVDAHDTEPDRWDYYRYIDFIGALHQLGVSTVGRPALSPNEYEQWASARTS